MKKKDILLIFSLAFNIGFILAFVYHIFARPSEMPHKPPPPRMQVFRFHNEDLSQIRKETNELRKVLFLELAKNDLDTLQINEISHILVEKQGDMEKQILHHFKTGRLDMTDEEAEEFFTKLAERHEKRTRKVRVKQ